MEKVKVIVKGAGSLEVEWTSPKDILSIIDFHLGIEKAMSVHKVKRGPKKRVKALDEGSEAVPAE